MALSESQLRCLAEWVGQRNAGAAADWQKNFEAHLDRIVRGSLRREKGKSKVSRRILALAKALDAELPRPFEKSRERQIKELAQQICAGVLERLRQQVARRALAQRETIRDL